MSEIKNKKITLVLLPGLNGTAGLFEPLLSVAADDYELMVIDYPTQDVKSYAELTEYVLEKISIIDGSFFVLGESFSGPLAMFLAGKKSSGLMGIILVATFVSPPYFPVFKYLPWTLVFKMAKPLYWLRIKLSGAKQSSILETASRELQKVKPLVLAERVKAALSVDASDALKKSDLPIVYFHARYDVVVPKWNLNAILIIKPNSKVATFNTQHFLLQSAPQQAWDEIEVFIKENTRHSITSHPTHESGQ